MIFKLELISKSRNFIFYFLFILNSYFQKNQFFVCSTCCQFFVKKNCKVITVLKSPHVNKKSKKKFIFCTFKINMTITLNEKKKFFLYKLIILKMFIDFKINFFLKKTLKKKSFKNYTLNKMSKKSYMKKYMFLLDSCGEKLFTR